MLFNPFEFPNLHWKNQRDFLLKHFATEPDLPEDTASLRDKMKSLKQEAAGIPYQISEVQRQLSELPTGDVDELEKLLSDKQSELANLQTKDFSREEKFLSEQIRIKARRREELLTQYHSMKTTCPTCGQSLPKAKVDAARNKIVSEGKQVAAEIEQLRNELETLKSKSSFNVDRALKAKQLQSEIRELTKQISAIHASEKLKARLATLVDREKSLNAKLIELEGQIFLAQERRRKLMIESEETVNAQFEHVRFKLFKLLANGEVKEDCAAMIGGIHENVAGNTNCSAAFKAADAESYTSNSLVELPNQLFLFKVTEADLEISVDEGRRAA